MKFLVLLLGILPNIVFASVWDKIDPSMDFRYRLENYDDELDNDSRSRHRIRARIGLKYQLEENKKFILRLATGDNNTKATSTNQTLGSNRSESAPKDIYIDRAYANITSEYGELNLGRMKNMFFRPGKSQMLWDGDVNFDGIHGKLEKMGVFLHLANYWVQEEESVDTNNSDIDITINAAQLGYTHKFLTSELSFGLSRYNFENSAKASYGPNGNGVNLHEIFVQYSFNSIYPITIAYSDVANDEADDLNKANYIGLIIGKAKKVGEWSLTINQRTVEANALDPNFSDSDFAAGKNDSSGMVYSFKYILSEKSYGQIGYFDNKRSIDADEMDYKRLHIDYGLKF